MNLYWQMVPLLNSKFTHAGNSKKRTFAQYLNKAASLCML